MSEGKYNPHAGPSKRSEKTADQNDKDSLFVEDYANDSGASDVGLSEDGLNGVEATEFIKINQDSVIQDNDPDATPRPYTKRKQSTPVWEFVEGQDLTDAKFAEPDPSKFFMVRQDINNNSKIDVRQYLHISNFDWNDKAHIKRLNLSRRQIKNRTYGSAAVRLPWSQREKYILKHEIIRGLQNGYTWSSMPWEQIAHNLNANLKDMTQKAGSLLAKPSKWDSETGREVYGTQKAMRMIVDRVGSSRSGKACKFQARKFGDVSELLKNSDLPADKQRSLGDMLSYLGGTGAATDTSGKGAPNKGKGVAIAESSTDESSDDEPSIKKSKRNSIKKEGETE